MEATKIIRDAVIHVALLRQAVTSSPELSRAVSDIKHFQARRFAGTYFDLLHTELYKPAALFFLSKSSTARRTILSAILNSLALLQHWNASFHSKLCKPLYR